MVIIFLALLPVDVVTAKCISLAVNFQLIKVAASSSATFRSINCSPQRRGKGSLAQILCFTFSGLSWLPIVTLCYMHEFYIIVVYIFHYKMTFLDAIWLLTHWNVSRRSLVLLTQVRFLGAALCHKQKLFFFLSQWTVLGVQNALLIKLLPTNCC